MSLFYWLLVHHSRKIQNQFMLATTRAYHASAMCLSMCEPVVAGQQHLSLGAEVGSADSFGRWWRLRSKCELTLACTGGFALIVLIFETSSVKKSALSMMLDLQIYGSNSCTNKHKLHIKFNHYLNLHKCCKTLQIFLPGVFYTTYGPPTGR